MIKVKEYVGVDINPDVLKSAKVFFSNHPNCHFYSLDEFEEEQFTFDCIILSAVIEHLLNPVESILKLKKILSNNGKIIITTPTPKGERIHKFLASFFLTSNEAAEEHNQIFNQADFVELAGKCNCIIDHYELFEFGLNQIVIIKRK